MKQRAICIAATVIVLWLGAKPSSAVPAVMIGSTPIPLDADNNIVLGIYDGVRIESVSQLIRLASSKGIHLLKTSLA